MKLFCRPHAQGLTCTLAVLFVTIFQPPSVLGAGRDSTSVGFIPMSDLGTGLYLDQFQGGLYPNGSNAVPTAHADEGTARAANIEPLAVSGDPDPAGKMVLLSIGFSNVTQEFCAADPADPCTAWSFSGQAQLDPDVNKDTLAIVNGAAPAQDSSQWTSPDLPNYIRILRDQLLPRGLSEAQVQVVWLKMANAGPRKSLKDRDPDAIELLNKIGQIVRALGVRYPNLKIVFLSSRIYAGYTETKLNSEPFAYESAFSVKWLIEAQIEQMAGGGIDPDAGDLDFNTVAPWLVWGPYLWADGLTPRNDGLTWAETDFEADGTHPSRSGEEIVGSLLLDFMLNDPFAMPWFNAADSPQGAAVTVLSPNGGETFVRGTTETIAWSSTGDIGAEVSIRLHSGAQSLALTNATPNDGSFPWDVPPFLRIGSTYQISVASLSLPSTSDISDSTFTINDGGVATGTLNVLFPNGGETVNSGSVVTLTWSSTGDPGSNVKIQLLRGAQSLTIVDTTPNDGSFDWAVPAFIPNGSNFRIDVSSLIDPAIADMSDGAFSIVAAR